MLEARRPVGRLFYLLVSLTMMLAGARAQAPATTTVSDTVYRGDGNTAGGTLLIFWPAFTTAGGQVVAGGTTSVPLGAGGALSVALVPNVGATPAGTLYTVVYQLDDGTAKTEYWLVPVNSPVTIANVRTPLGVMGAVAQLASQQFVNNAIAVKANDTAVVHLAGSETISGAKQFAVVPSAPAPVQSTDVANKAYVDAAVTGAGGGSFVSKSGDSMTGPLVLPGDPAAPLQASTRHYVDTATAAKADVLAGLVPAAELGTGTADGTTCLLGNQSWGPCTGSSGNAVQIQGVPVDTTTPADNQVVTYVASLGKYEPRAGGGVTAGMQAVKYATDFAWSQSPSADLSTAGVKTVTLAACPSGVKGAEPQYYVYIAGTGTAEAALVTGGTCAGNGAAGTLQFTTVNAHAAGYTVGSASGGLQEAIIAARFAPTNPTGTSQSGSVIVPPGEFNAYARVSIRSSNITVDFSGSIVSCLMNDTCIFVGDGLTLKFYLSQTPFTKSNRTLFSEEYPGTALNAARWSKSDPASAVSVSNGNLQVAGGTGIDGATVVEFVEQIELGGATLLRHGDVVFNGASSGVLGGLYTGGISAAECMGGFQLTANGSQTNIQALVNGAPAGAVITTVTGHHYVFTTRVYTIEIFRRQQIFHSELHPAGSGLGGGQVAADVRVVLEVHEIDPTNPATQVAASTVLFDGVIASAPGYCKYALVNALNAQYAIAFTQMIAAPDTEVRSALPGAGYRTRLVGGLSDGAECTIVSGALDFFTAYVPAPNEFVEVHYRGPGRAFSRVTNPASIAAHASGTDDGVRSVVRHVKQPAARTAADCENAGLAFLEGTPGTAFEGEYGIWSDSLPGGAEDIFPGDALQVNAGTRGATFAATVREVQIELWDLAGERSRYNIKFAEDGPSPVGFQFAAAAIASLPDITPQANSQIGSTFLADLTAAVITSVSSTTISVDAGVAPLAGGGFEVRWSDSGWGAANDRNLIGRFSVQAFTLPRLSRAQSVFLRQYDASSPQKYSRYSAALHVDYPL
jgi:hypothetical protein